MEAQFHLTHNKPAMEWNDALMLGNGFLGAAVYGHTSKEIIQINDDSLWYGKPYDRINPLAKGKLNEIQQLVLERKFALAEELIFKYMASSPASMRNYSTLGELDLALNQQSPFPMGWLYESDGDNYSSDLDLKNGVLTIEHDEEQVHYRREMFISNPDRVLCCCLESSRQGAVNLDIMLNRYPSSDKKGPDGRRPGKYVRTGVWPGNRCDTNHTEDDATLVMTGHEAETGFAVGVRVVTDGMLENCFTRLAAKNAGKVIIYLASATSNRTDDCVNQVREQLNRAEAKGYANIRKEHREDFASYMERCSLALREDALSSLYFQYNRYLLVSGSRENSEALNLQGIWNGEFNPFWDSKYTININTQMNYWPVEVCNLSALHEPLFDLLEKMKKSGKEAAEKIYGCRGMMCHHNTDFYGDCGTQDIYPAATVWQCGGAWLGLHLWEHYLFTGDKDFLADKYPLLNELALFFVDFLIEDKEGYLVTCPSVSPENRFITGEGEDTPICAGPAMDNQIIRALMRACIDGAGVLDIENPNISAYQEILRKLRPDQIDSKGCLMEWSSEEEELTPDMVHTSHLWAAFPGMEITWQGDTKLFEAAKKALRRRIDHGADECGWPLAWHIALNARFLDKEAADIEIQKMLKEGISRSLLNAKGVFQIDGNLGTLAGMAECLLQSHIAVHFLPALPPSWKNGMVKGLRARGGIEVSMSWEYNKINKAQIKVDYDRETEFIGEIPTITFEGQVIPLKKSKLGYTVYLEKNRIYHFDFN